MHIGNCDPFVRQKLGALGIPTHENDLGALFLKPSIPIDMCFSSMLNLNSYWLVVYVNGYLIG